MKNTFSYIFINNKIFTGIEINSYIENEAEPSEKDYQVYTFINNNLLIHFQIIQMQTPGESPT